MLKSVLLLAFLAVIAASADVATPTLKLTTPATGSKVTNDGKVVLTCASATAGVTYEFHKGGETVTGSVNGVLTLEKFTDAANKGEYTCKATKDDTSAESGVLSVAVGTNGGIEAVVKPTLTVTVPDKGKKVEKKAKVELTCLSSTAGVSYEFYKKTAKITVGVQSEVLTIASFTDADKGEYTCKATKDGVSAESAVLKLEVGTEGGSQATENSAGHFTIPLLALSLCALTASLFN